MYFVKTHEVNICYNRFKIGKSGSFSVRIDELDLIESIRQDWYIGNQIVDHLDIALTPAQCGLEPLSQQ